MTNDDACPHFVRGVRLHWDSVRQRHLLLFPEGALILSSTAAAILKLCDGQLSIAAIVATLQQQYHDNQIVTIETDVHHLLHKIAQRGLLVYGCRPMSYYSGNI